jgi:hypothetical protein
MHFGGISASLFVISLIITVIFRLGLLWFVRQAFILAMCPWFGLRFCNYLTLQAYCSRAGALHPAPAVILSAFGDEAVYRSALWVKLITWVRIVIHSVVRFQTGP